MFKYNMYAAVYAAIIFLSFSIESASLDRNIGSLGLAEQSLNRWIDNGDYKTAWATLEMRANPNAVVDGGKTLFMKAFEKATPRDENNHIVSVDDERAKIVVAMAKFGGNLKDLDGAIAMYYKPGWISSVFGASRDDLSGINVKMFPDMGTALKFKLMVEEMKESAKNRKRL